MPQNTPKNDEMVGNMESYFRRTYVPAYSWADVVSSFCMLTGLRGFWPMTTIDSAGAIIDLSGLTKTLTLVGVPVLDYAGLTEYLTLPGASYYTRPDEADLDILGTEAYIAASKRGMTVGGWFRFSNLGAVETCVAKDDLAAQRSFLLQKSAANVPAFTINGAVSVGATAVTNNTWYFLVGRYVPSTSIALFIDDAVQTNVAAIPAAITNSNAAFRIGADSAGGNIMTGRAALCFCAASQLSNTIILSLYHASRALFGK
jgi:hypothetical protein